MEERSGITGYDIEMNKVHFNIYWLSLSWGLKVLVVKAFLNPYEFIDWEYHSNMLL